MHINSGIPNRAFYLAATALGGHTWEAAGRIWYETLRDPALGTRSSFQRFAEITVRVAQQLHGSASAEDKAVDGGWEKVGVPAPTP